MLHGSIEPSTRHEVFPRDMMNRLQHIATAHWQCFGSGYSLDSKPRVMRALSGGTLA